MPTLSLNSLPLDALLGVAKLAPSQTAIITSIIQDSLLENFFKNILIKYVTKEELDVVVNKKADPNALAEALEALIKKYPVLSEEFKKSVDAYKVAIMKERVEEYKLDGRFNVEEYAQAKELLEQQNWEGVYNLIMAKDSDNFAFSLAGSA